MEVSFFNLKCNIYAFLFLLIFTDGQMKTKYIMAGCKSTQHGRFKIREDLEALLLALSDIVLVWVLIRDVPHESWKMERLIPMILV